MVVFTKLIKRYNSLLLFTLFISIIYIIQFHTNIINVQPGTLKWFELFTLNSISQDTFYLGQIIAPFAHHSIEHFGANILLFIIGGYGVVKIYGNIFFTTFVITSSYTVLSIMWFTSLIYQDTHFFILGISGTVYGILSLFVLSIYYISENKYILVITLIPLVSAVLIEITAVTHGLIIFSEPNPITVIGHTTGLLFGIFAFILIVYYNYFPYAHRLFD